MNSLRALSTASIAAALLVLGAANAQDYPARPIRIVVPFGPAGTPDLLARALGEKLSALVRQPVIVENRPGASGNMGADVVARAAPDGYHLLMVPGSVLTINPSLYAKMPFDVATAFAPVSLVADMPNVLVVMPSGKADSTRALIEEARRSPGLAFSSPGAGTVPHLAVELLRRAAGVSLAHVPYKSGADAVTAVMGGHASATFANLALVSKQIEAGTLRALGVASPTRSPLLPNVPTIAESGLGGFDASSWFGLVAPANTPPRIVGRLSEETARALRDADLDARFSRMGVRLVGSTPEAFADTLRKERTKWDQVVRASNIRLE